MSPAEFCAERAAELQIIRSTGQILSNIRAAILAIRPAHSRARADAIQSFVLSMSFFKLCEYADEDTHSLRHEFCCLIKRQRSGRGTI